MMAEGLLEDVGAGEIIVPLRIQAVINTSCPQLSDLAEPIEDIYWILCDLLYGSFLLLRMYMSARVLGSPCI